MATLKQKTQALIKLIGSRVEETAYNELPTHVIALCGAAAGALATLVLLAVAHLGDVIVLRHYYAFIIGYVATVFSAVSLIAVHTVIGAIAAYVHLRAEEYFNFGQWLASACFLPLFAPTGTYIADRLTEIAWTGESPLTSLLRALIAIVATLALTWLFWIPWLSLYRIWLARRIGLQRSISDDPETLSQGHPQGGALSRSQSGELDRWRSGWQSGDQDSAQSRLRGSRQDGAQSSSSLEASRSYMRTRRQIALMRKYKAGEIDDAQLLGADLFDELSWHVGARASSDELDGTGSSARKKRWAKWLPTIRLVAIAVVLIGGVLYNSLLPDGIRGVSVREGSARSGEPVRVIMKSPSLGTEFIRALANEALGGTENDGWVDVLDISQFSMFALQTVMSDGRSGVVISTRQDLMEMDRLGMLVDLKPFAQRDQLDLLAFVDPCIAELSSGHRLFGLPLSTSPLLLFINTEALSRTDLVPRVPPVLWSDLLDYAKALTWFTDSGGAPVVSQLGFATSSSLWHAWLQLALASDSALAGSGSAPSLSGPVLSSSNPALSASRLVLPSSDLALPSSDPRVSGSGLALSDSDLTLSASDTESGNPVPSAWRLLVDVASGLRATSLLDNGAESRNPFYERPYDPAALFASGQLAMVIGDYSLHTALSSRYPDVQYGVADIPAPDWAVSGVSISNGLGIGILRPNTGTSSDSAALVEASWQVVKAIAGSADMQARVAERSGMLPGLKSLYSLPSYSLPGGYQQQRRSLHVGNEEIEAIFYASQLAATPATYIDLPSSSLVRLCRLLDRLTQGAESVPDVMEQIAVTLSGQRVQ